jgi:hypothetical protein
MTSVEQEDDAPQHASREASGTQLLQLPLDPTETMKLVGGTEEDDVRPSTPAPVQPRMQPAAPLLQQGQSPRKRESLAIEGEKNTPALPFERRDTMNGASKISKFRNAVHTENWRGSKPKVGDVAFAAGGNMLKKTGKKQKWYAMHSVLLIMVMQAAF